MIDMVVVGLFRRELLLSFINNNRLVPFRNVNLLQIIMIWYKHALFYGLKYFRYAFILFGLAS